MSQIYLDSAESLEAAVQRHPGTEAVLPAVKDEILTVPQALDLVLRGPRVDGFNVNCEDPRMPDDFVRTVLNDAFTVPQLLQTKVGMIRKYDSYLLHGIPPEIMMELVDDNRARYDKTRRFLEVRTRGEYMDIAKQLEGVTSERALTHRYKIRASNDNRIPFGGISLHSFGTEQPSDFDYLEEIPLSPDDKKRAYILGTAAHEVGHRLATCLMGPSGVGTGVDEEDLSPSQSDILCAYRTIVLEELSELREQYVTDYVLRHKQIYKSSDVAVAHEDLVESIRVMLTNPAYLADHFPRRHAFLHAHMSFLKEGSIVDHLVRGRESHVFF